MHNQRQYNSISYARFQESMGSTDAYFNCCKERAAHLGERRNLLTTNVNQADQMCKTLEKEVAQQNGVIENIEKRYWTPRLQACDDADAMAVWLSKRKAAWNQIVDLCRRCKVRVDSLREIHTRNQRLLSEWQERAKEANQVKLLLYSHLKHASIVGAPPGWKSPVPTRVSTLHYAAPPPAPAPAPAPAAPPPAGPPNFRTAHAYEIARYLFSQSRPIQDHYKLMNPDTVLPMHEWIIGMWNGLNDMQKSAWIVSANRKRQEAIDAENKRPAAAAAAAAAANDDDEDDVVEVVGEKSWAERDKELRAQALYVG